MIVFLSVAGFFYLRSHLKSVIQDFVKRETQNKYKIDFSKLSVGIWDAQVSLKNAAFVPVQAGDPSSYEIRIPSLFLKLHSWKPIIMQKKIEVDSLVMERPEINIRHEARTHSNTGKKFALGQFYENLKKATTKIGVHSLHIQDASLILQEAGHNNPLIVNNINLRVHGFASGADSSFLSSKEFIVEMGSQHWELSAGHEASFSKLYFSGNELRIDSCNIKLQNDSSHAATSFKANKLLFKINNPASLYQEELLRMDTLYCEAPVLSLGLVKTKSPQPNEKKKGLDETLEKLFGPISINFLDIDKGRIELDMQSNDRNSYASTQTDLEIYNLSIDPKTSPHLFVDKINLNLNEVKFSTPDSLYFLTIKNFGLLGNDLIAHNAILTPTEKNNKNIAMTAEVPVLKLSEISLMDLLQKRFVASNAWIENPHIRLVRIRKKQKQVVSDSTNSEIDEQKEVENIYETMRAIAQLVQVNMLYINNGSLEYSNAPAQQLTINLTQFDFQLMVNNLLQSNSALAIKKSIPHLRIGNGTMKNLKQDISLKNLLITGVKQLGGIESITMKNNHGLRFKASDIFWEKFSWDSIIEKKRLVIDSVSIGNFSLTNVSTGSNIMVKKKAGIPIHFRKFRTDNFDLFLSSANGSVTKAKGQGINIKELKTHNNQVHWADLQTGLKEIVFEKGPTKLTAGEAHIHLGRESFLKQIQFHNTSASIEVPEVKFNLPLNSSNISELDFSNFTVFQPRLQLKKAEKKAQSDPRKDAKALQLNIAKFNIENGSFDYSDEKLVASAKIDIKAQKIKMHQNMQEGISFDLFNIKLEKLKYQSNGLPIVTNEVDVQLANGHFTNSQEKGALFTSDVSAGWKQLNFIREGKNKSRLALNDISGDIERYHLALGKGQKINLPEIAAKTNIRSGSVNYSDSAQTLTIGGIKANAAKGIVELDDVSLNPKMERDEFFKAVGIQKDYLVLKIGKLKIEDLKTRNLLHDTILELRKLIAENAFISSARDKNLTFIHGIEKHMPTKLISQLKIPLKIDTIQLKNASVNVHEISNTTKKEGIVPLTEINGYITNITNYKDEPDSLRIAATGRVLDYNIRHFRYAESYADSLSGFRMNYRLSPMKLTTLTQVTVPLVSVSIIEGSADTLHARMSGNKHGAHGEMHFYYRKLKIKILDKKDTLRKTFLLSFENFVANRILIKSKNRKNSSVFFLRNKEKFVFNYWVKSLFSGIFTSAGVKKNRKYRKQYETYKDMYSLPL